MGNWHAWENVFLRSKTCDLGSLNLMAFSVINNVSVGSRCFFDFSTGHSWGSPVSLTGNRILDSTGEWAVMLDNAGPYLVIDTTRFSYATSAESPTFLIENFRGLFTLATGATAC